jgi:hypothetical protein
MTMPQTPSLFLEWREKNPLKLYRNSCKSIQYDEGRKLLPNFNEMPNGKKSTLYKVQISPLIHQTLTSPRDLNVLAFIVGRLLVILMLSSAAWTWFCFLDEGRFVDTLAAVGLVVAAVLAFFTGGVRSAAVTLALEGAVVTSGALFLCHFECLK